MKNFYLLLILILPLSKTLGQGKVEVIADPAVEAMDEVRNSRNKSMGIKVYRIMVAFYPTRTAATEKLSEVNGWFGSKYGATMLFDEPNFKIFVGEFYSKSDADAAMVEVRKKYRSATIVYDYKTNGKSH